MGFQGLAGFGGGATGLAQAGIPLPPPISASGGTENTYTDPAGQAWKLHTFVASGSFVVSSVPADGRNNWVDVVVVAGGGGGGHNISGGGGGGGMRVAPQITVTAVTNPLTIGAGGAGSPGTTGATGAPSTFFMPAGTPIVSTGGGGGAGYNQGNGIAGGSGGGACGHGSHSPGGSGGGGNNGGNDPRCSPISEGNSGGPAGAVASAGGGGAGGNSGTASPGNTGGNGGDGLATGYPNTVLSPAHPGTPGGAEPFSDARGPTGLFAGGGAGGGYWTPGNPGPGGGGKSGNPGTSADLNGISNTGGGGGGSQTSPYTGGTGGSGIIIVRYRNDAV